MRRIRREKWFIIGVNSADKLKDVAKVLPDLIPDLSTTIPCYMSHQNVEGAIYCGECNPNRPDFD